MENGNGRCAVERKALMFARKALKLEKPERKLDTDLLLREGKKRGDMQLQIRTSSVESKWKEVFERCYGQMYRVSGQERGRLKKMCSDVPENEIIASMLALFIEYTTEQWFVEKGLVPSLLSFISSFDKWKAKGYTLMRHMSKNGQWWVTNFSSVPTQLIKEDLSRVLKIEDGDRGWLIAYEIHEGKAKKKRIRVER